MDVAQTVWEYFTEHAYVVVFAVSTLDATGTPMPGRLTLVAAGALAATGAADLGAIIVLAAAGALLRDHLWYLVGRFGGGRITALYCRITRQADDCEARAVGCFASYGGMAIVIARFFTAIRILISPIAARNGMPYLHYLAYDARSRVPDRNTPNAGEPDRPAARSRRRRRERDEDEGAARGWGDDLRAHPPQGR